MRRLEEYIDVGAKRMRCGYTTGTCAAAAARAAAELLVTGAQVPAVRVATPAGLDVIVDIESHAFGDGWAECSCIKDSGDDPDITNGVQVYARVEFSERSGVEICGGEGIGRVTRAGLDQPVGEAAINSVPRKMIVEQVKALAGSMGSISPAATSTGSQLNGFTVTVSIPAGVELAKKTFNPKLGIEGGISVIGTSGIVRPMSEDALIASIELEMHVRREGGCKDLLVMPGNYGYQFARDELGLDVDSGVQCSNYIGAMLDAAAREGFRSVLVVGHVGKLAKVATGAMNTHSKVADGRHEAFAEQARLHGGSTALAARIENAVTTDEMCELCAEEGLLGHVASGIVERVKYHMDERVARKARVEIVMFSKVHGLLGATQGAAELVQVHKRLAASGE